MRRTLLYLSVALLAFGISSFFAVKLYRAGNADSVSVINVGSPVQEETTEARPIAEDQTVEFTCENEAVRVVWEKLIKDRHFREDDYVNVIEPRRIEKCEDLFYEPQALDLNDDKADEIILMGERPLFCGSGGDCKTWILSKINERYEIIFEGAAGEDSGNIKILNDKSHKFKDLKIKQNNHFAADTFGFFKFDGKKYQMRKCLEDMNSNYEYDDDLYPEKLISVKLENCTQP